MSCRWDCLFLMKNIIQSLHNVKQSSTKIASFSILNLDSEFPLDAVSLTVPYGINSVTVSLENYKAGFIISKNNGSRAVLQSIENLDNDDYSFTVSDGNYSYKKETVLSLENSFFDKTDGEFSLSLCLFNKTDNYLELAILQLKTIEESYSQYIKIDERRKHK